MTKLLKKAIKQIKKLPREEQNAIADLILTELKWDKSFSATQVELNDMADEVLEEHETGNAKPLLLSCQ